MSVFDLWPLPCSPGPQMHNGGRCWSLGVRSLGQRVPRCLEYCAAAPIRSGWWAVLFQSLFPLEYLCWSRVTCPMTTGDARGGLGQPWHCAVSTFLPRAGGGHRWVGCASCGPHSRGWALEATDGGCTQRSHGAYTPGAQTANSGPRHQGRAETWGWVGWPPMVPSVGCAVHRLQADLCGLWGWQ